MLEFVRANPARIFAVVSAVVALVAHYVDLPSELVLAVAGAVLGMGETVQRVEDRKTGAQSH